MGFFDKLFGSKYVPDSKLWPNLKSWAANQNEGKILINGRECHIWTVACGDLAVPSGQLVVCDPFAAMETKNNPHILVPKGKFSVSVTLVDVSEEQDRTNVREAYASIAFTEGAESYRKAIPLACVGEDRPEPKGDEYKGFFVDAGTACFVDSWSVENCMPDGRTWYEGLFENSRPDCWFNRMDDPAEIRVGIANITLPLAKNGENLILFHSGYGDGTYPVVGSFDKSNRLLSAHVDFFVIPPVLEENPIK